MTKFSRGREKKKEKKIQTTTESQRKALHTTKSLTHVAQLNESSTEESEKIVVGHFW